MYTSTSVYAFATGELTRNADTVSSRSSAPVGTFAFRETAASADVSDTCTFEGYGPLPNSSRGRYQVLLMVYGSRR